jgi:hypothetical protein
MVARQDLLWRGARGDDARGQPSRKREAHHTFAVCPVPVPQTGEAAAETPVLVGQLMHACDGLVGVPLENRCDFLGGRQRVVRAGEYRDVAGIGGGEGGAVTGEFRLHTTPGSPRRIYPVQQNTPVGQVLHHRVEDLGWSVLVAVQKNRKGVEGVDESAYLHGIVVGENDTRKGGRSRRLVGPV